MQSKFLKILNIEKGEEALVFLILTQSFFIGTFMATFEVVANALFLANFGPDDLGKAYAVSAGAGIVLTFIYTKLQNKIKFSWVAIINIFVICLLTALMRFGFVINDSKQLIYVIFILQGPMNTLVIVGFWGLVGRLFTLRQGKRLFGMIDSGQIFGMILISFAVPFLLKLLPSTEDILFLSTGGIVLSLIMQVVISTKYGDILNKKEVVEPGKKKESSELSYVKMFKNPYIFMMVSFVVVAMLAQFFIHYSFLIVSKSSYPSADEFAQFFSIFMGVLMIFTFVFKTFVFSWLMQTYGLRINVLILPVIFLFFTVLAVGYGTIFGFTPESSGFTMFFMFIIIGKLFAQSLRSAIEVPAFKLFYQPLDNRIKHDVQAKVDGTVNEFSALLGGLALMGLSYISFVELIHYSYVLVAVIALWIYVGVLLYRRYKETLRMSLVNLAFEEDEEDEENGLIFKLEKEISSSKNVKAQKLKIINEISPFQENKIDKAIILGSDDVTKDLAMSSFLLYGHENSLDITQKIKKDSKDEDKLSKKANRVLGFIQSVEQIILDLKTLSALLRSKKYLDRVRLTKAIRNNFKEEYLHIYLELMKDPDHRVRKSAIYNSVVIDRSEIILSLIENLKIPQYRNIAKAVLIKKGEDTLQLLDSSFRKSGFDVDTLSSIVEIISTIDSPKTLNSLLDKISYPDSKVSGAVLKALGKLDTNIADSNVIKIQQAIEDQIGIISWNLALEIEAEESEFSERLIDAIIDELDQNYDKLYELLALLYDSNSIKNIRKNIESGSGESIGFAIELLDLFVAEELKPKLFPVFEDISIQDKLLKLQDFNPRRTFDGEEILKQIINRDFNKINRWTKACAIHEYLNLEKVDSFQDLIAQMFNTDKLLNQIAAIVINHFDQNLYTESSIRLNSDLKLFLDKSIRAEKNELLFNRVNFSKYESVFRKVKGGDLVSFMESSIISRYKKDEYIVVDSPLIFVLEGEVKEENTLENFTKGTCLSKLNYMSNNLPFIAGGDVVLLEINEENFYCLLSESESFANEFIAKILSGKELLEY